MSSIKILVYILSSASIPPDHSKIKSIRSAGNPETVTKLKECLGLVQFVGRYVHDLATVDAPLWEVTKKFAPFHWLKAHQDLFDKVKQLVGDTHTLAYHDESALTTEVADASPVGSDCVLHQTQKQGV